MLRGLRTGVRSVVRRLLERVPDNGIKVLTGQVPIGESKEEDVFIVGYPKSGNTWFQNLAAGVVHGVDPRYASDTLIQELVPEVHYKRYYRRYGPLAFFKSHSLPKSAYRRVVYLLRDGRDVMVSYFHALSALKGAPVDFAAMVREREGLFPCAWHEHVEAWLANPYHAEMIVVKYEGLKANAVEELKRFCRFAGLERDVALLDSTAEHASFEEMQRKEQEQGWDYAQWPRDKRFVRRGQVGSYRDEMPEDILALFVQEAGDVLRKCGYLEE